MPPIAADGRIVGIIYPPPEVRNIVDKTASFVARNGPEFEQKIKQNELNNPKFTFLNSGDPYHAYYQHKVSEIRDGKEPSPAVQVPQIQQKEIQEAKTLENKVKQRQSDLLKQVQKEQEPPPPKDPPPDFEFIADPPSISAFDLDVVKLTAQFVARNGRQFLTNLMNKEQRNYQFDFLRPQHSLFQYFTKLLEQYTKVLIPPKDLLKKLADETGAENEVKGQIDYRVRWIKFVEAKKRREEEAAERERVSYAQIDWHNFVVVETVDYQPWEVGNFPPPTNPQEVGARVLMQRRIESNPVAPAAHRAKIDDNREGGANTNVEDMEEGSSDEDEEGDQPTPIGKPLMAVGKSIFHFHFLKISLKIYHFQMLLRQFNSPHRLCQLPAMLKFVNMIQRLRPLRNYQRPKNNFWCLPSPAKKFPLPKSKNICALVFWIPVGWRNATNKSRLVLLRSKFLLLVGILEVN